MCTLSYVIIYGGGEKGGRDCRFFKRFYVLAPVTPPLSLKLDSPTFVLGYMGLFINYVIRLGDRRVSQKMTLGAGGLAKMTDDEDEARG